MAFTPYSMVCILRPTSHAPTSPITSPIAAQFREQPGAGRRPLPPDGAQGEIPDFCNLFLRQAAEVAQFHNLGLPAVFLLQSSQRLVERQDSLGISNGVGNPAGILQPLGRPPRFRACFVRLWSTRIWRMA